MALVFPVAPVDGQLYPFPAQPGTGQWRYDAALGTWVQIPFYLRLQEGAYNSYSLPITDGATLSQLTTDGTGVLDWTSEQVEYLQLGIDVPFDGSSTIYTLSIYNSVPAVAYVPNPPSNISPFLDGTSLAPFEYQISGSSIIFDTPPAPGSVFFATTVIRTNSSPIPPPPTPTITVNSVAFLMNNPSQIAGPPYSTGSNISPTISWSVSTSGITTGVKYDLIMEDLTTGNSVHWNLTGITGTTVSTSGIGGATIVTNDFPAGANSQGYTGPFPSAGLTEYIRVTVTPVLPGATVTPGENTVPITG